MFFREINSYSELSNVISNDVANIIKSRHKFYFHHYNFILDFMNRIKGKEVVIVGSGPSAVDYKPFDNVVHIAVNKSIERSDIDYDFWFFADYTVMTKHYNYTASTINSIIENQRVELVISKKPVDIESSVPNEFLNEIKQFHLVWHDSQNIWDFKTPLFNPVYAHCSIGHVPLSWCLFFEAKCIYLVGFDQSGKQHFDGRQRYSNKKIDDLAIRGFKMIGSKFNRCSKIISINPVGLSGIFEDKFI